jgi:hypothetical protein
MTTDDRTKAAVLELLSGGQITLSEAATLIGESRQCVRYWAEQAGIDVPSLRRAHSRAILADALSRAAKQ